ncbi:MAG TPA: response regulator [Rhizomicrobium sp.]|jgi:CheY-like chemotaxis protein|nr:response regulator [Rhizomicrobium sp.]
MIDRTPILVAEDEAMLRLIAVEMLQDAGFEVFEAADGAEALDVLRANPAIELLVSDVKMPRMDGYALVEAGLAFRPELKVLLMTGYSQEPPAFIQKIQDIQILRKPFNLERLCALASEMTAV